MLALRSALPRLCLLAVLLACADVPAAARDCPSWPGEPRPLPSVADGDRLRARWAELRAAELAERAEALEATAPLTAYRVWQRVLCVAPGDEAAREGARRTRPLRVHRPALELGQAGEPPSSDTDPWQMLDAPLALAARAPAPRVPRTPAAGVEPGAEAWERAESLRRVERWLATAEAQVEAARFEEALTNAARARAGLSALGRGRDLTRPRLRLELVEATAEAARGRDGEARACFARVLALDPAFALDARTTSPKLLRLLDAARAERGSPQ